MSELLQEDPGASPDAPVSDSGPQVEELARYTIHVPVRDNNKNEIPQVLAAVRKALSDSGFPGRTVLRKAEGDWTGAESAYDTEEMDLVMVDAPDNDENLQAILTAAQGVKDAAGQEAVYVTVTPLRTYLV